MTLKMHLGSRCFAIPDHVTVLVLNHVLMVLLVIKESGVSSLMQDLAKSEVL